MNRTLATATLVIISAISFIWLPSFASAASSNVTVSGTTLQLTGSSDALYEINTFDQGITVSIFGGSSLLVKALNQKELFVTPVAGASKKCSQGQSVITLAPTEPSVFDYTITIGSNICGSDIPTASPSPQTSPQPSESFIPTTSMPSAPGSGTGIGGLTTLRNSQSAQDFSKGIGRSGAITLGIIGAIVASVVAYSGFASVVASINALPQIVESLQFWFLGALRFRKRRPWGLVMNKQGNVPIAGVSVQIYDAEFKKLKDAQITDQEGRFSGLILPGFYYIKASKSGFSTYESQPMTITSSDQILNLDIVLAPLEDVVLNAVATRLIIMTKIKNLLELLNPYILIIGTLLSIFNVLVIPSAWNWAMLLLYIALDLLQIYLLVHLIKPFGKVFYLLKAQALPLAVIRLFDYKRQLIIGTKVSDTEGRFNFLVAPGQYYFTCAKVGYKPFTSDTIDFKEADLANFDIKLEPVIPTQAP